MTTITLPRATVEQALEALGLAKLNGKAGLHPAEIGEIADAIAALRAALAQQDEPDLSRCPQCNGPADNGFDRSFPPSPYLCTKCMAEPVPGAWVASPDGRVIYDDTSKDDGLLRVSGDFENDEQRIRYAQRIVDKLNAAPPKAEPVGKTCTYKCEAWPECGCAPPKAEPVEPVAWECKAGGLKPLTSDKDRPDQGATYVEGYGYVDTRAVRAVEKASWEKNHG